MEVPVKMPPAPGFPPSPCIDVCKLNEQNVCIGCKRTIDEIARWSSMTADEQRRVLHELPKRRA